MFGPIAPRIYFCRCGWNKYIYGSKSDVLVSEKQVPPNTCEKCGSDDLKTRVPNFLERWKNGKIEGE